MDFGPSQRFQVKISGQWNDYASKEDDVLKVAFDNFIRKTTFLEEHNTATPEERVQMKLSPQESFKELVIKGRRYVVDFHKMVQVRKDNKKDYKVRPPAGSVVSDQCQDGPREQGALQLKCEQCKESYTLRQFSRCDDDDWADCRYCQDCWRVFLDKEKDVEEKKGERSQKQHQVQGPSRLSTLSPEKSLVVSLEQTKSEVGKQQSIKAATHCAYCDQPFRDDQAVFLGACDTRCELCHDECGKKQNPDALAMALQYSIECPKSNGLSCTDMKPGSHLIKNIQEEYQRRDVQKGHSGRRPEVTAC